ncbi:MAG: carbon-nitrogen hydrolase family protein [Anaerolineae bacterium]|nr:carbon-nitrogen hydrolase family protein [Anaerolineae bacterium]
MTRKIKVAAVQMNANLAPTAERLAQAERLVIEAAEAGAQLVVLPEVFNTGYGYREENHSLAEPVDGPTATWMRDTAARLDIHLAGSLMVLEGTEVYNALLLFAPDGRRWRYDKNYPWGWERGYFRPRRNIAVAHTDLGDIGLLICWDVAHLDLWAQYAGQVEMIVVASCPPNISNPTYCFSSGDRFGLADLGPLMASLAGIDKRIFRDMPRRQGAWLGAPVVGTVGCGQLRTPIPNGLLTLLGMVSLSPGLIRYLPQANSLELSCGVMQGTQIVDAQGNVLSELTQADEETWTMAEVTLGEKRLPQEVQPAALVPWVAYLLSDMLLPMISIPVYRRGLRKAWGEHMSPIEPETKRWLALLGVAAAIGLGLGVLLGSRRRRR